MTTSNTINQSILKLAIPNIVTNITVPLLGLVDLALMGQLGNPVYIGAIAIGSIIFNIIYSSFNFLRMGSTGFTAQAYGAKQKDEISLVLIRSLLVALGLAISVILFQYPIQWISFKILGGSEDVRLLAQEYFYIRIWAAPATIGLYAFFGWFLGVQNAKVPMIIALVINVVNILLNFLFVNGFGMTSDGVAIATVIAQYSGLFLAIYFLLSKYKDYVKKFSLKIVLQTKAITRFFRVNTDIFIRTLLLLLTLAFFTNTSAKHGDDILAINTLLFQFFFIFSYFADGFAFAGEALTGKAYGANNRGMLKKTITKLFYWGWGAAFLTSFAYAIGINTFMGIMTNNSELLLMARDYNIWVILIPITSTGAFIWDGIYVGVTASKEMRNAMIISSLLVFLPAYYLTSNHWGNDALWFALNTFMVARTLLMWAMWQRIKGRKPITAYSK
ncbi:MAG: MATE family efflux transporter [Bacteroidetes bacterium]|nr:MATE family efflux transporter [Bacteroidota bacterium]